MNPVDSTHDIAKAAHDDAATTATAAVQGATSIAAVSDTGALGAVKRGFASATTTGTGTYQVVASNDISARLSSSTFFLK